MRRALFIFAAFSLLVGACGTTEDEFQAALDDLEVAEELADREGTNDDTSSASCDAWGIVAKNAKLDYDVRVEAGVDDPEAGTKNMFDYDTVEPGSPTHIFYDEVLAAITAGAPSEEVQEIGLAVCARFPDAVLGN